MPPQSEKELVLKENTLSIDDMPSIAAPWNYKLNYVNITFFVYAHISGIYGMYLMFTVAKWSSIFCTILIYFAAAMGITAGAHRLFSHRSFKATTSLQITLMLFYCLAYQRNLVRWIRDHRLHHKYSDTDADPHNASRGFFFSHIGWIFVEYHPEVVKRRHLIQMQDIYDNPVIMFQKRNSQWMLPLIAFVIPTAIPWFLGETLSTAYYLNMFRFILTSNLTFLTNSLAHSWGFKPYDKGIRAAQNYIILSLTLGEGFHNFHHVFPFDYRSGEVMGNKVNFVKMFIDFCGWFGLAYDMKVASEEMVKTRMSRTGDKTDLWGY